MITVNVFRDLVDYSGANPVVTRNIGIGSAHASSATLTQRINNADELTVTCTGDVDVLCNDILAVFNERIVPLGLSFTNRSIFVGRFRVHIVESTHEQNGQISYKLSATAEAAAELIDTGTPSYHLVRNADLFESIRIISDTISLLGGDGVTFNYVNVAGADYLVSSENTQTLYDLLNEVLLPSQSRWRVRTDLLAPTIEIGRFGNHSGISLVINQYARYAPPTPLSDTYIFTQFSTLSTIDNCPNSVFPEGGVWSDDKGHTGALILWPLTAVPGGFHRNFMIYPNARGAFRLDKDRDENHNLILPFQRRSRRIVFGGVVPLTTNGGTPAGSQVVTAAEMLSKVAADYLRERGDTIKTWTGSLPYSFTDRAFVGDKVNLGIQMPSGQMTLLDDIYLVSKTTLWGADNVVMTNVELSTILESFYDPISYNYNEAKLSDRAKAFQEQYTDTLVCNPTATYTFPPGYTAAPILSSISVSGGCTAAIDELTFDHVTFTISGCGGSQIVTFSVTPPY